MPVIESPLDLDFYKLTTAQFAFARHPGTDVEFGFINRTKTVKLAEYVKEERLREELAHVRELTFSSAEIAFLRETSTFSNAYLSYLKKFRFPEIQIKKKGGHYLISAKDKWPKSSLWETLVLSVMTELFSEAIGGNYKEGMRKLNEKIAVLKKNPDIKIIEFGTRRRYSKKWQKHVLETLLDEVPNQVIGTSNVKLAAEFGIRPIGTFPHELLMVYAGIYNNNIAKSHNWALQDWWNEYGESLSIALTDTYGTDFFFRYFTSAQAKAWRGLRHDSGDPIAFGEKAISFYNKQGIDPREKVVVFSDGLNVESIVNIHKHFQGRIKTVFGWGTNLTNDVGAPNLSLVMKVLSANGHPVVKLSDNIAKATGLPSEVERFKKIFGYTNTLSEACKY